MGLLSIRHASKRQHATSYRCSDVGRTFGGEPDGFEHGEGVVTADATAALDADRGDL